MLYYAIAVQDGILQYQAVAKLDRGVLYYATAERYTTRLHLCSTLLDSALPPRNATLLDSTTAQHHTTPHCFTITKPDVTERCLCCTKHDLTAPDFAFTLKYHALPLLDPDVLHLAIAVQDGILQYQAVAKHHSTQPNCAIAKQNEAGQNYTTP